MKDGQRLELVGDWGDGETIGARRIADCNSDLFVLDKPTIFRNFVGSGPGFVDIDGVETDTLDPTGGVELLRQQFGRVDRRCIVRCGCPGEKLDNRDLNFAWLALRQRGSELQIRRDESHRPGYAAHAIPHGNSPVLASSAGSCFTRCIMLRSIFPAKVWS